MGRWAEDWLAPEGVLVHPPVVFKCRVQEVLELGTCRDLLTRSLDRLLPGRGGPSRQRSSSPWSGKAMVKPRGEAGACSRASLTLQHGPTFASTRTLSLCPSA